MKLFIMQPSPSSLLGPNILLSSLFSNTLDLCDRPSFTPITTIIKNVISVGKFERIYPLK